MSKNFRSLGRGRMPSGLAVSGKGKRSAAEIAVGVGAGVVVGGGALYAYDRYTSKDDEEPTKATVASDVEQFEANEEALDTEKENLKNMRKSLNRKERAVNAAEENARKPGNKK